MSIVLQGSTSGSITLQEPAIAGSTVLSLPATTGTVLTSASPSSDLPSSINGPAFSAYKTGTQTVSSSVYTKVTYDTELFDTNNNFASSRFTPTVAGYYQLNAAVYFSGSSNIFRGIVKFYKNGSAYKFGNYMAPYNSNVGGVAVGACLVYLNGSTDYVEVYTYIEASNASAQGEAIGEQVWFDGCLVRAA